MAPPTAFVNGMTTISNPKRNELQPCAHRQASLPACIGPRISSSLHLKPEAHISDGDGNDETHVKKNLPSQSLSHFPDETLSGAFDFDENRSDPTTSHQFRKRQTGFLSPPMPIESTCISSTLRRRLSRSCCVYLHLGFLQGHRRRTLQNSDLIIVRTSTSTHGSDGGDNAQVATTTGADTTNGRITTKAANWQPVAWAHSLPCVVNIPVTLETFARTHVSISFNIATRRIGTANAMLSQLANPRCSIMSVIASTRTVVVGNISASLYVPPLHKAKCMSAVPGVAIAVRMAASMRREARHVVYVQLDRVASGATPLSVAEVRIIRRGERQAFLAASSEALQFALDARQAERAELHVVWKGAPKRGADSFTHGVWRFDLAAVTQLRQGQLHALPWCEASGMPVVMRSLMIDSIDRRNDMWWCIDVTLTR